MPEPPITRLSPCERDKRCAHRRTMADRAAIRRCELVVFGGAPTSSVAFGGYELLSTSPPICAWGSVSVKSVEVDSGGITREGGCLESAGGPLTIASHSVGCWSWIVARAGLTDQGAAGVPGGDFLDHADLGSMVVSGTALLFPRFGGVCGSAGQRVALRFGDRCGGEALAVASGGGLSPAAGGDDAERERDESAAAEDGPGGMA
jgi:hypothetical protein